MRRKSFLVNLIWSSQQSSKILYIYCTKTETDAQKGWETCLKTLTWPVHSYYDSQDLYPLTIHYLYQHSYSLYLFKVPPHLLSESYLCFLHLGYIMLIPTSTLLHLLFSLPRTILVSCLSSNVSSSETLSLSSQVSSL